MTDYLAESYKKYSFFSRKGGRQSCGCGSSDSYYSPNGLYGFYSPNNYNSYGNY